MYPRRRRRVRGQHKTRGNQIQVSLPSLKTSRLIMANKSVPILLKQEQALAKSQTSQPNPNPNLKALIIVNSILISVEGQRPSPVLQLLANLPNQSMKWTLMTYSVHQGPNLPHSSKGKWTSSKSTNLATRLPSTNNRISSLSMGYHSSSSHLRTTTHLTSITSMSRILSSSRISSQTTKLVINQSKYRL